DAALRVHGPRSHGTVRAGDLVEHRCPDAGRGRAAILIGSSSHTVIRTPTRPCPGQASTFHEPDQRERDRGSDLPLLLERAAGESERGVRRRYPAVDRGLEDDLLDLLGRESVAQGRPDMHLELLTMTEGDHRGEYGDGAGPAVQPGAGPHVPPRGPGDEILEVLRERADRRVRSVH